MADYTNEELALIHRYWQAANYLSAAQIYLGANPLLKEPLRPEHIKPRLMGHWGTCPGLNLVYVHLNRLIKKSGANVLFIAGPGHGAPAVLANLYLEGTYGKVYPDITADEKGMALLCRRFAAPGGIPTHVNAAVPGAIHEGGELGYCLMHAAGAVFDNPGLLAVCVIGDGEAETAPLEGSWKSIRFLNPARDGAILPVLHLNGYKISSATVMARLKKEDLTAFLEGYGYTVYFVEGENPADVHSQMAEALDKAYAAIMAIQHAARHGQEYLHLRWPLIVLRTLKGWTGPEEWKGEKIEGTFHAHQVPLTRVKEDKEQLRLLERWLLGYQLEMLFDDNGTLLPELSALIPAPHQRMGANPNANGGVLLKALPLPEPEKYAVKVSSPGVVTAGNTRELGKYIRDVFRLNKDNNFRMFCPDEAESNKLQPVFEATGRFYAGDIQAEDEHLSHEGRVMEVLSEHLCQGWMEGYLLTGRHGLFTCYEAFVVIIDSMFNQYAKWLKNSRETQWRRPLASFNYLLTSHTWRQDHNGYSHQGPGFIDTVVNKKSEVIRIYFPPDANCLLCIMDHCLAGRDNINLVVAGKQPQLQWLDMEEAKAHCAAGASLWQWAGNEDDAPDIVLACCGDVPTLETVAAAWLLRKHLPALKVRVINVVDLMALPPPAQHPHGMDEKKFDELFTASTHVIFAFHGYVRIIHDLVHGRPEPERFHVRGFMEEGTTTTPFDMAVLNNISRYQLAMEAIRRSRYAGEQAVISLFEQKLNEHHRYIREHLDDMPEIKDWQWEVL
ncbi:phosphoketolase family protein [Chitinophaga sp. YIM B06452]|uniref:phosphoketolase family protein n=1 Tax=Chitinophaga sp. YIM B06452 TaxID=3082158 RepID=UPI0031FEF865